MPRLIDADELKKAILKERDAIPTTTTERYGFGVEVPYNHGNSMRGGIRKALRCVEQTPTVNALVLPCKVGDAVYMEIGDDETQHFVDTGKVFAIGIDESGTMWISVRYESGLKFYHPSDDIGKTVFLTREEAEAALAKMDGGDA